MGEGDVVVVGLGWRLWFEMGVDSWEQGRGEDERDGLVILPAACTIVGIDSSVWPRDTGDLPCRLAERLDVGRAILGAG